MIIPAEVQVGMTVRYNGRSARIARVTEIVSEPFWADRLGWAVLVNDCDGRRKRVLLRRLEIANP